VITPENVKRFETLLDLFSHPGWALLCEEFNFKVEAIKEGFTVFGLDPNVITYGQGRISVYRELEGLPIILRNALDEQKEDEQNPV